MIAKGVSEYDLFTVDRLEEYRYVDVEGGIKIVGYSGLREYIEIPESIDGKTVLEIGLYEEGYPGSMGVNILLPNTVSYIDPMSNPANDKSWYRQLFIKDDNQYFCIENNFLYSKDKKSLYMCFYRDGEIDDLIVPEGVENIGKYAFVAQRFKSVKLPNTLKSIGDNAFSSGYTSIEIPESVEIIGDYIARTYSLVGDNKKYVILDGCVYTEDMKILVQCIEGNISQISVPDCVEEIRPYAFKGKNIIKLELGNGVLKIGEYAFVDSIIKTIRIPDQLVDLADTAFGYLKCNSIRVGKNNQNFYSDGICFYAITPDGGKRLLKCFKNKETEYVIPNGVVSIAPEAFSTCENVKKIVLPDSLISFDENCLISSGYNGNKCSVKKIIIPSSVKKLNVSFDNYKFEIHENNCDYYIEDGILYHVAKEGLEIVSATGVTGELVIKDEVVRIKSNAFASCKKITKIICGTSLKVIEHNAFSNGRDSTSIQEIILNDQLEYIDYLAFAGSKVGKVHIPTSILYICVSAFDNCKTMEYEVESTNTQYTSVEGCLYNNDLTELKYVPKMNKIQSFKVPESVTEIGRAFRNCDKIEEIILPKGVTCIWLDSLYCKAKDIFFNGDIKVFNYRGINFWGGVKVHADKDSGAVQYVEWLKRERSDIKVFLAINGMEDVSALTKDFEVVLNDTGLTIVKVLKEKKIVEIPEKIGEYIVTKISKRAFASNYYIDEKIQEIIIPDTVIEIGENAFESRKKLKKVTLSKSMKIISQSMFQGCEKLEEVVIPEGVEKIATAAFFGCGGLKKVYFPKSIQSIDEKFLSDEDGEYKDLYLSNATVFVVEKESYAEQFLKNYKPDSYKVSMLNITYFGMDDSDATGTVGVFGYESVDENSVKSYFLSRYDYDNEVVVTPSLFSGRNVTVLSMNYIGDTVKELTISKTIEKIEYGNYAFAHKLEKLIVDHDNKFFSTDGLSLLNKSGEILYRVFCFGMRKYTVPDGVKIIDEEAFSDCDKLEEVTLPDSIEEIRKNAFGSCSNLKVLVGLERVKKIGENAIADTAYAQNLDIIITGTTFVRYKKTEDKKYTVPDGIEEISKDAFYQYSNENVLEELYLPNSLKSIKSGAFANLKNLKEIIIPEGVTEICDKAFSGCENLVKIQLPMSLIKIGDMVFEGCYALRSIDIPCNVSEIGTLPFPTHKPTEKNSWRGDSPEIIAAFEGLMLSKENKNFVCKNGVLYSYDEKELIYVPDNYPGKEFVVPTSVKTIKTKAFYLNRNIEYILFEGVIDRFEENCFSDCEKLRKVVFASEQKKIVPIVLNGGKYSKSGVFVRCKNLKNVELPDLLEEIGDYVFYDCALPKIELPSNLKIIGNGAFEKNNIEEVVLPKSLTDIGRNIFAGTLKKVTLFDSIEPFTKDHLFPRFASAGENWPSFIPAIALPDFNIGSRAHDNAYWGSFEVVVLSADTEKQKYKVYMPSSNNWGEFDTYVQAWGKNASFDFEVIDKKFGTLKENKIFYVVERLRCVDELSDSLKENMIKYLNRCAKDFVKDCIDKDNLDDIKYYEQFGIIKKTNVDDLIKYSHDKKNKRIEEFLKEYNMSILGSKTKIQSVEDKVVKNDCAIVSGYHKVDSKVFSIASAMNMDTSVYYCEFRFRGLVNEIEKLTTFLIENGLSDYDESDIGGGISEVRVFADETTPVLVKEFPALKVTGLCEDWRLSQVKVVYSESGYTVFTQCKTGGYFDSRHDGGDGRWALEYDMMKKINVSFTWLQTGDKQRVNYSYPFKKDWESRNYTIEIDGDIYEKDAAEEKKGKISVETDLEDNLISGKSFVVTGKLNVFANRDEMKEKIESLGGKLSGSISSKTTALVTNTPDSGTSKNIKAQELGVDIITEQEFIDKYLN